MYPQRNTRMVWCWMDRCRYACRLDEYERLIHFLVPSRQKRGGNYCILGTVLEEIG